MMRAHIIGLRRVTLSLGLALLGACSGNGSGTPGSGQGGAGGTAGAAAGASGGGGSATGGSAGAAGGAGGGSAAGKGGSGGAAGGATGGAGGATGGAGGAVVVGTCTPPADVLKPYAKLSQTGCMDAANVTKMAASVLPYEVNSPLWSDGADKSRGFIVPAGKKIHVKDCAATPSECTQGTQDTGKWVMPAGTVMVKNFGFDGKLIETRLLVKYDHMVQVEGVSVEWAGYSYQWNEAQTDATIVPNDEDLPGGTRLQATFNTGKQMVNWRFPYRFDCNVCHVAESGGTLGPETRQMNRTVAGSTQNQIDKWAAMNLFETAPAKPYQAALMLPYDGQLGTAPTGASTLDARARSYLHANCSYCHRPDGAAVNWLDFRYDTTLKNTGACGVDPVKSTLGVTGAQILKPGMPMLSTIWLRMHAPWTGDKTRMPQLATYVVDDKGLQLMSDWITSITTCPN
jgi:uncharacterized repeat protein (TIGR03806 family)